MSHGLSSCDGWGLEAAARSAGQREMAAAEAADGALGLDLPAASGSRWRRNAARQDFSRSAEARRIIGRPAVARERLATEVSRASTAANMTPASTAPARAVRPEGLTASCVRSRSSPARTAITASRLPGTVTVDRPFVRAGFQRTRSGKLGDSGPQAVDVGLVVVVDQAGPNRAAGAPPPVHAGPVPRVGVAVPDVDPARGQVLGDPPGRRPG